jgi:hypothetical protein
MTQWLQHSSDYLKTSGSILDSFNKNFQFLIMSIIYIYIKAMLLFLMRKKKSTISDYFLL